MLLHARLQYLLRARALFSHSCHSHGESSSLAAAFGAGFAAAFGAGFAAAAAAAAFGFVTRFGAGVAFGIGLDFAGAAFAIVVFEGTSVGGAAAVVTGAAFWGLGLDDGDGFEALAEERGTSSFGVGPT